MQTYFKSDPHLTEWIDDVIEKTITICILSGQDCTEEFQKVKAGLEKILNTLNETTDLTPLNLKDALTQLLEQRYPDQRLIEHIPGFQDMILQLADETLNQRYAEEAPLPEPPTDMETEDLAVPAITTVTIVSTTVSASLDTDSSVEKKPVSHSSYLIPSSTLLGDLSQLISLPPPIPENPGSETPSCQSKPAPQIQNTPLKITRTTHIPENGGPLSFVLKEVFPQAPIHWNVSVAGFEALAKVNDLLVFADSDQESIRRKLKGQGWHLVFCSTTDLFYHRRLERVIRQSLRQKY